MSEPQQIGTDQALWAGRVALYKEPEGSVVVVFHQDGGEPREQRYSPVLVALYEKMAAGKGGLLKMLGMASGLDS